MADLSVNISYINESQLVNSSINDYVVNNRKWFIELIPFDYQIKTVSGYLQYKGGGTIRVLIMNQNGEIININITNVAYAPKGIYNLVLISALYKKAGLYGHQGPILTIKTKDRQEVGYYRKENRLYYLILELSISEIKHDKKVFNTIL